jgi:hypothetical protein
MLMMVFMIFLAAYSEMSRLDVATTHSSQKSSDGFFAAEAGLNTRAEAIRGTFIGYNRPSGTSPNATDACEGGNQGSGDFQCRTISFGNRSAITYVVEPPGNPQSLRIPPGERFQGLTAQEYRYTTRSVSKNTNSQVEAQLELAFRSRLVPLFQFAIFYDKDLEILPGPEMIINGPIHTNRDLFLNTDNRLRLQGQVTVGEHLYRGRKNDHSCTSSPVEVMDPSTARSLISACSSLTEVPNSSLRPWNGMIEANIGRLEVPEPEEIDPSPGRQYWDLADIRLVLKLVPATGAPDTTNSPVGVEVRTAANALDVQKTAFLNACSSGTSTLTGQKVIGTSNTFRNNRESTTASIRMLEIDVNNILSCIHSQYLSGNLLLSNGNTLDDSTQGGLVIYATIDGPTSTAAKSLYGVRLRNGNLLTVPGAPTTKGLTIASDHAVYVVGDYNNPLAPSIRRPAAIMTDAINILSNNWLAGGGDTKSTQPLSNRVPTTTTVNAAILSGTETTGGVEGTTQTGTYNGGVENYLRFHEAWTNSITLHYTGSLVSLSRSRRNNGAWVYGGTSYTAPRRNWQYDTRFNDAANLPPLTPHFVYLRQELFVRDYDRE